MLDRKKVPRVAFVAHALLPEDLSTVLITEKLKELGRGWPGSGEEPGFIKWFSCPILPQVEGLSAVWLDFYIIPLLAADFLAGQAAGRAYGWCGKVALSALDETCDDGVPLTIGWGAYTKLATSHGLDFMKANPDLAELVSTTHGDAGTACLVVKTLQKAGVKPGFNAAVIGANGAIGDVLSRCLVSLKPASITLVGKVDNLGESKKRARLENLRRRVTEGVPEGQELSVDVHQDKSRACHDCHSNVVIVATGGDVMKMNPSEIPDGSLVLDMTTPSACRPDSDWAGRLVLTSGCGEFNRSVLPQGFGQIAGREIWDVGAGGSGVIWGCTGETVARAAARWNGHLAGPRIPSEELVWCAENFKLLGFGPQPPVSFGRPFTWDEVRAFVRGGSVRP